MRPWGASPSLMPMTQLDSDRERVDSDSIVTETELTWQSRLRLSRVFKPWSVEWLRARSISAIYAVQYNKKDQCGQPKWNKQKHCYAIVEYHFD